MSSVSYEENKKSRLRKVSKSSKRFKNSAQLLAMEFGRKSTIHAMNRIFQEKSNLYERCFWLLTLTAALLGSIYVCLIVSSRFKEGSLQTVVESTNKPVFEIPFPEVTICNENHLNWERIDTAKSLFMPNETNMEKIRLFELVIGLYDSLEFGNFNNFHALKEKPMTLVKNINFSLVFEYMTWRCDELLTDCVWQHLKMNCCDIFLRTKGLNGICWNFNTLSTEEGKNKMLREEKYPWRIGSAGSQSGLTLRVLINPEKHYRKSNPKGILVGVTEPQVFHKEPLWIPANTETAVEVDPVIYLYDNGTRSLSSASRQCLFTDENNNEEMKYLSNFPYMIENCQTQCRQEYLLKYCNCTVDLFFPPDQYPVCTPEDLLCLARNNDYFRFIHNFGQEKFVRSKVEGMICNCFRNCYSLNYITDARSSFLPSYLRDNKTFVDLDVYYRFEKFMVFRTSLVFSWVDLMVAFGGIAGLFLGCSLISGIELVYFVLVELPVFIFSELKSKAKLETTSKGKHHAEFDYEYVTRKGWNWVINNRIGNTQKFQQSDAFVFTNPLNGRNNAAQEHYFIK